MEEHIKKYSQIAQTGHYEPPKIEESKEKDIKKIEPFEIIEPKKDKEDKVEVQMDNNLISVSQQIQKENEDFMTSAKRTFNELINNKKVSYIINPFQDESKGVQMCYKIYSTITCLIILLVLLLSIFYS